jgi:hypothetical protein
LAKKGEGLSFPLQTIIGKRIMNFRLADWLAD